ncbi:MAG: hypothetical protein IPI39_06270 [Candidatus Obscuribacter sp.]|nr:hypothetical protein [Candidatus Obscuribacter sp.]
MAPLVKSSPLLLLICTTQASPAQAPQKTNITNFKTGQIIQKPPPTWMKGHGEIPH